MPVQSPARQICDFRFLHRVAKALYGTTYDRSPTYQKLSPLQTANMIYVITNLYSVSTLRELIVQCLPSSRKLDKTYSTHEYRVSVVSP